MFLYPAFCFFFSSHYNFSFYFFAYLGLSHYGEGRSQYLKTRYKKSPEGKFYFPVCSSWEYGWTYGQDQEFKCPDYGRRQIIKTSFYRPNDPQLKPREGDNLFIKWTFMNFSTIVTSLSSTSFIKAGPLLKSVAYDFINFYLFFLIYLKAYNMKIAIVSYLFFFIIILWKLNLF